MDAKKVTAGKGGIAIFGCANGGLGPNGGKGGIAIFGIANAGNSGLTVWLEPVAKTEPPQELTPGYAAKEAKLFPGREALVVTEE